MCFKIPIPHNIAWSENSSLTRAGKAFDSLVDMSVLDDVFTERTKKIVGV